VSDELKNIFETIDLMFQNADIDFNELQNKNIDKTFFEDYNNTRIVNSFLFNFSKLQDKIGGKLFKKVLYELKEIDDLSISMIDLLHLLEKLGIIENEQTWDKLREIRNSLAHEYPFDLDERIENIRLVLDGYVVLKLIYKKLTFNSL